MDNTENQNVATNEQKWMEAFAKRHPDVDVNDREAYFGRLNDEVDRNDEKLARLQQYDTDNERISGILKEKPAFAEVLLEIFNKDNAGNEWRALARTLGPDFVKLMEDPENEELAQQIIDGQNDYAERIKKNDELVQQAQENLQPTMEAFVKVCDENDMTTEQRQQLFDLYSTIQDNAIVDKVDEDTWRLLAKAVTHDVDVQNASSEGEVRGRNAKIMAKMKKTPATASAQMMRGQRTAPEGGTAEGGFLANSANMKPWYEQGE